MKNIDLNLLPALQALLELRNVSRAAERMHLSQSAMSASLARLRRHFNDDLLVRAGRGYELTAFAEGLVPRVDRAMANVQDALQLHVDFDPATSDRRFVVAASDYAVSVLLAPLRARLSAQAPQVQVDVVPTAQDSTASGLGSFGAVDVIVGPMGFDLPGRSRALFRDEFVVLVDEHHPLLDTPSLTVADLARVPQVVGGFGGRVVTPPMQFFTEHGQTPQVVARLAGLQALPSALPGTDLVALVPRRLAHTATRTAGLVAVDLQPELEIPLVEAVFWHPLHTDDPGNAWLRSMLVDTAAALADPEVPVHPVAVGP